MKCRKESKFEDKDLDTLSKSFEGCFFLCFDDVISLNKKFKIAFNSKKIKKVLITFNQSKHENPCVLLV